MTITCTLFVPNTKNEDKCVTLVFLDPQESKSESRITYSIKLFHLTLHGMGVTRMRNTTVLITQTLDITAKLKGQHCIMKMTKNYHKYCKCTS